MIMQQTTGIEPQQHSGEHPAAHPAAEWALQKDFTAIQVDCTTAVVLKIMDNKCKMLPGEINAVMAIYDAVKNHPAKHFNAAVHAIITSSRDQLLQGKVDTDLAEKIHQLRVHAEAVIPKPVMKSYKAFLRDGLFG